MASGSNEGGATLNSGPATDGNGYQTLALLPNQSGGYVLIVQPPDGKNFLFRENQLKMVIF